ncbi:hypothetical protein AMTR_s00157p00058990 [Amborella trichopoda]|uniref:Tf2-1-like SH3-like domain-containing protein n=1 Tax=Amborella trichopoda TaxID=13333 RepID=W1PIQ3_AMBTC|nr:hypothetical protein AMTR_s00157p00058990 [Amborella trichopoda]
MAQFCYNLRKNSSTEKSPFELAKAHEEQLEEACECLDSAIKHMKKYVDQDQRHLEFGVGDHVLLKLPPQIWKKISAKTAHQGLIQRYDCPLEVIKCISKLAYRLALLDWIKVYLLFHVSFLKPYHQDKDPGRVGSSCTSIAQPEDSVQA